MKYRYPFKTVWLPALLFAACLSMTLISTMAWLISAAANDSSDSYIATADSVIPAILMLGTWIGCGMLAGRLRLKALLWFSIGFWGLELVCYLLCLTPLFDTAMQVPLTMATLPLWSYFALVALLDVQNTVAQQILTVLPMLVLLTVFVLQLITVRKNEKVATLPGKPSK